ncbi:hypothetical protein M408DRAFT_25090 [Serendipita vermifera MAFF 305830]|uniref:Uncharacterized protein n=1 Tax=Serendipita vermifera MAFF 305830 TaxID=933852 RepID=A0A0C3B5R2_SERVB|nr:hypothetical protein M408DRAFT_25090 [Serendipita vermifera MAFF 305830]
MLEDSRKPTELIQLERNVQDGQGEQNPIQSRGYNRDFSEILNIWFHKYQKVKSDPGPVVH